MVTHRLLCIRIGLSVLKRFKVSLEIRHAPATPGSRTSTFSELTGAARTVDSQVIQNLPLGNVKAKTNGVIKFQEFASFEGSSG